ncbi:MAG: TolC family protein [Bacteroidetes bacterium]|uniref:TolC family protein n=1 Tax=Candidatus Cryptobacteroides faecipullorum TaxID=2840764 RepID=A0A9D9NBJ7_9BACT|nr:TolC family protein [Candidatus Cryptobacteroides faecipullorum]
MRKIIPIICFPLALALSCICASAQYRTDIGAGAESGTENILEDADTSDIPVVITLEQALQIALSENVSVKVADQEIQRTDYARKGTYASLFPQIDVSGSYQRTIKKQVMYMDLDMGGGTSGEGGSAGDGSGDSALAGFDTSEGLEVGRWNTWAAGLNATMPLVNTQLWKSLKVSGLEVELAIEKARSSRLDMVTQVKQAFFATLLAKEAFQVYKDVYENAVTNCQETEKKFRAQKATEYDLTRAKTNVANAVPDVYNAESSVILSLWQLKAVMGVDLDMNIDVAGTLDDYSQQLFYDSSQADSLSLEDNTTMRQLAIQAEQLAHTIKMQKYAYIPTLSAAFSFSINAMTNDFKFSQYQWTPYSYVGVSLAIPIFSGGKRYNDVRQAKTQATQLKLQTMDTERNLRISIRQSLVTMETNIKTYNAAREAVASARKGYSIAEKTYQVGKNTLLELNDARLALTQAELSASQAIYNFLIAKSQLEQTLGQDFIR